MEKPREASATATVRSINTKVIVITPKQLANFGIDKEIKQVATYQRVQKLESNNNSNNKNKGDGANTTNKPETGELLNTLRAKINVLLAGEPVVSDQKPADVVCFGTPEGEKSDKSTDYTAKSRKPSERIEILSNKLVKYSRSDLQNMIKPSQPHVINGTLEVKNSIRGTVVMPKSKIANFVPDRTSTPPKQEAAEELSSCDIKPLAAETTFTPPTKHSTVPWNQLLPSTFANRHIVKTYSKQNAISVVVKKEPDQSKSPKRLLLARIIKTSLKMDESKEVVKVKPDPKTKESSKPKDEVKPKPEEANPKSEAKSKTEDAKSKSKEDKETKAEEIPNEENDDTKTIDEDEPATPVAPKKRGRPRKTPLQPKVDEDSEPEPKPEKAKKEIKETVKADQSNPTPRRRGRPRKVAVEPKPDEHSSDEDSPVEKKRRQTKKPEVVIRERSTTGTRTSGRKRKVVDYAALSGGRISSSEEEDFAEILAQEERSKKKTKEDKEDIIEEAKVEKKEDVKEPVKSPKIEAVHPLKKRLKMEHAQAIEKEKLEESNAEKKEKEKEDKDKNGVEEKMDTSETTEEKETKDDQKKSEESKTSGDPKEPELVSNNSTNKINDKTSQDSKTDETSEKEKTASVAKEETSDKLGEEKPEEEKSDKPEEEKSDKREEENNDKPEEENNDKPEEGKNDKPEEGKNDKPEEEKTTEAETTVELSPKEIKCAVCNETVDSEASWAKHKLAQHNDLAWKVGDQPLTLEDTNVVFKILTNVLRQYGTLSCLACGEDFTTVKKYLRHTQKCGELKIHVAGTPSSSTEPRRRGRKPKTNGITDLIEAMIPTLDKPSVTSDSGKLCKEKKLKPVKFGKDVVCAVCKEEMKSIKWSVHKLQKHNNLAWREGEQALDMNDHKLIQRILADLYYRKIPLRCEKCGAKKKSVIGFLSHKTQCQKSYEEIEDLKVTCHLCSRTMLPVSLQRHMELSHPPKGLQKDDEDDAEDKVLAPRKAASKAAVIIESLCMTDTEKQTLKKAIKNVDFSCEAAINKLQKDIDLNSEGSCVFVMCEFRSDRLDYLMDHIMNKCLKRTDTTFTCNYCLKTDRTKQSIVEHLQEHEGKTDEDFIIRQGFEDRDFKETAIDPMDFLDDRVDCTVMTGNFGPKSNMPRTRTRIGFLRHIRPKDLWELFGQAFVWTMEFVQQNYIHENNFPNITLKRKEVSQLDTRKIVSYLPKLKRSIDVVRMVTNTASNPVAAQHNWRNFKLFESEIYDDGTSTIFCGGPVNALAWAPTPYEALDRDQILAVSVLPDPETQFRIAESHLNMSLIQFWNFGNLKNGVVSQFQPKLSVCIAHRYGVIWNLEWCPSGCYDFCTPEDSVAKRLGLLAVCTGDSAVYIYAVPQPDEIKGKILEMKPKFKLSLSSKLPVNFGEIPYHPLSLSWTKAQSHSHIAVGYSNGFIGVFNLRSNHHQTTEDGITVVYPYLSFHAHELSVTAISLNHLNGGNRWLVSGSADKDVKFWDLDDIDMIHCNKRYPVGDLTWNIHWISPVVCHDYVTLFSSVQYPVRDCNGPGTNYLPTTGRLTSVTSNDWGNLFMQASDCGEVIAGMSEQMHERFYAEKKKSIRKSRFLASYTSFIKKDLNTDETKAIEKNRMNQAQGKVTPDSVILFGPRSYDECKNYGLVISDLESTTVRPKDIPSTELDKYLDKSQFSKIHKPDLYPMQSIDKMALNQNLQSFLYYALGYHVGFVRVSIIRFLNNKTV